MRTRKFSRFKYAEEFCQELTRARLLWKMAVVYSIPHEEDGEQYIYDEFVVNWTTKDNNEG